MKFSIGFFEVAAGLALLLVAPFVYYAIDTNTFIHRRAGEMNEFTDKSFPKYHDLWISLVSTFVIHAFK